MSEEYEPQSDNVFEDKGIEEAEEEYREHQTASTPHTSLPSLIKAHVALIEQDIISAQQGELFQFVSYHYPALQKWHREHTGWRIEQQGNLFRLLRTPSILTSGYMRNKSNMHEPRDFAYLTWILWYAASRQLTGRDSTQQFVLSELAEQVVAQANSGVGEEPLDLRKLNERRSMARALRYLESLGALQLVAGQTQEWAEREIEVLYEFTDSIYLLIMALKPDAISQTMTRLQDQSSVLAPALLPETTTEANLMRAWRTLLIGPALLRYDDEAAFSALCSQAEHVEREIVNNFGWALEINHDYACIVRGSVVPTDAAPIFHINSAIDHIILLLCGTIRAQIAAGPIRPDKYGCIHMTAVDIEDLFMSIRTRYGNNWGKEARETNPEKVLEETYQKMRRIGLLRGPDTVGRVLILPTAARYSPAYREREQETAQSTRSKGRLKTQEPIQSEYTLWSNNGNV